MNKNTIQKWKKIKKDKEEAPESITALSFRTHLITQSEAEIIIPHKYQDLDIAKIHQILIIQSGKDKILAQVTALSIPLKQEQAEISILKNLVDLSSIHLGANGMFRGQIRVLPPLKIPQEQQLEIVEFLVKSTYFSRRDQYKVQKALRETITHVYSKKSLLFDEISLECTNMLQNNQTFRKTGIIMKNTKIVFRTNCAKYTFAVQLSVETFELNENKQLYLQKMIQFLIVFFHRNNFFKCHHRIAILFYARLFYPQFHTLTEAYDYLQKESSSLNYKDKFEINYAVALQKDWKGRIYQDVYRKIIWYSDIAENFRSFFWQKISQFIFTINWDRRRKDNVLGVFIAESLQQKVNDATESQFMQSQSKESIRIKPFVHRLRSTLASSKDSNMFQVISLISEQYRHHYRFRSLTETGNCITILTAGTSQYEVDETTYKMAKSYIYLTNISCNVINFNKKITAKVKVTIVSNSNKCLYDKKDKPLLQNLALNCIEKMFYNSPTSEDMIVWDKFQLKNNIHSEEIVRVEEEDDKKMREWHNCQVQGHFILNQRIQATLAEDFQSKEKFVDFISLYEIPDEALRIHQFFYEDLNFKLNNQPKKNSKNQFKDKHPQIQMFQNDLSKIIINKQQWHQLFNSEESLASSKIDAYIKYLQKNASNITKAQKIGKIDLLNNKLFECQVLPSESKHELDFETASNEGEKKRENQRFWGETIKIRKNSDYNMGQYESNSPLTPKYQSTVNFSWDSNPKVNIFEMTYKSKDHEYIAFNQIRNRKIKKPITHNKERLKNVYPESNIHYLISYFNQSISKKLQAFFKRELIESHRSEEEAVAKYFEMEKTWKNICFPLLTPIYTKYQEYFQDKKENVMPGVMGSQGLFEDEICKLLMKNYQIQEPVNPLMHIKLSKGNVSCHMRMNDDNLFKSYIIDEIKQQKIIPFMLYRYLCYEDKDYRFCTKYMYFQNKNYYDHQNIENLETKTVKIVLASNESLLPQHPDFSKAQGPSISGSFSSKKEVDYFVKFINALNDDYKELKVQISKGKPKEHCLRSGKKKINFSCSTKRALYKHEEIFVEVDTKYNPRNLFSILISWNLCSSVLVNRFVDHVMRIGRKSELQPFRVSAGDVFHTVWSITTLGEIVFEYKISLELLEDAIIESGEWLWDSNDYYMHRTGIAFIQFRIEKKLILWRDNNSECRNQKTQSQNQFYNQFFMKAATYDFMGGIIEEAIGKAISTKEKMSLQSNSIQ